MRGGYVIAPGAVLPDGRRYRLATGSWDRISSLPNVLVSLLKRKDEKASSQVTLPPSARLAVTERERTYAEKMRAEECAKLAAMRPEGRNAALNTAAHSIGTMVGAGWLERETAEQALWETAEQNGYTAKDAIERPGARCTQVLEAGIANPRAPLLPNEVPQCIRETVANLLAAHKLKHSGTASTKRSVSVVEGADIEGKPIERLWDGYLPLGELTLLAGAGGTAKSTIALNLAAAIRPPACGLMKRSATLSATSSSGAARMTRQTRSSRA